MIKINLLAEEIAAEELRRKDPLKRVIWAGGALVGLFVVWAVLLQFDVMKSDNALQRTANDWSNLEKQDGLIRTNRTKTGELERRLAMLNKLSTNRFLWSAPLNALQYCLVDKVEVMDIHVAQSYRVSSVVKDSQGVVVKPAVSVEDIVMTVKGTDYADVREGNHIRFMNKMAQNPYFKETLRKPDSFKGIEQMQKLQEAEGKKASSFSFSAQFQLKTR